MQMYTVMQMDLLEPRLLGGCWGFNPEPDILLTPKPLLLLLLTEDEHVGSAQRPAHLNTRGRNCHHPAAC
jgi:hypothetical protein